MSFTFTLEPVLRLRKSFERLERLRLLAIAAMILRVREEIAGAAREEAMVKMGRRDLLAQGMFAAEMQLEVAGEKGRVRRKLELAERLAALQRQHAKQGRAYQLARRKRDILEKLRETKMREYRIAEARREQRRLDELYLLRRFFLTE